jgi:hypothetical protein
MLVGFGLMAAGGFFREAIDGLPGDLLAGAVIGFGAVLFGGTFGLWLHSQIKD